MLCCCFFLGFFDVFSWFAKSCQAEEDALFFQQFQENENRQAIESRVRPYAQQVMMVIMTLNSSFCWRF